MTLLIIVQTIFYAVASIVLILFAVLMGVVTYEIMYGVRALKGIIKNIQKETENLQALVERFVAGISKFAFIANFFKRKKKVK